MRLELYADQLCDTLKGRKAGHQISHNKQVSDLGFTEADNLVKDKAESESGEGDAIDSPERRHGEKTSQVVPEIPNR